ncbi:hypothetical protein VKT23_013967 [Stygiomarasmius scandens]|uniref:Uncharacterized protein n=1 Tax=Marasmiellus scandens TaxID=2682957 RepID=A0ABR1J1K5_9AGAR
MEDMRFLGKLKHGVYDDCEDIDPALIERFYGADLPDWDWDDSSESEDEPDKSISESSDSDFESDDNSGLGFSESTDDDETLSDLEGHIAERVQSQIHHAPIAVPKHANPFSDDQEKMHEFLQVLSTMVEENLLPKGYSVREEEWGEDGYPTFEVLRSGRRGLKELRIALPIDRWLQRARLWVQALVALQETTPLSHTDSD